MKYFSDFYIRCWRERCVGTERLISKPSSAHIELGNSTEQKGLLFLTHSKHNLTRLLQTLSEPLKKNFYACLGKFASERPI